MKQLDSEIGDITKIMKDLARIVHDQGETVDSIEANVEHTAMYIQQVFAFPVFFLFFFSRISLLLLKSSSYVKL